MPIVIQQRLRLPGRKKMPISASTGAASGHRRLFAGSALAIAEVWMVSVELADVLPGVTEAGEKLAVAPVGSPLTAKVTAFENVPFCGVTAMVYVAEPPGCTVCGAVGELRVKVGVTAAVPVPVSAVVCGEPDALSATESVAAKLVADAGVNVT